MREAFTYMFKDNCYYKKALVYFILTFIESACIAYAQMNSCSGMCPVSLNGENFTLSKTNVLVFQLIGLLFNFLVVGYFNTCIEAITKQVNNIVIPFFNFVNSFLRGLKYFVAILIPILGFSIIVAVIQMFNLLVANIILTLITIFYILFGIGFIWLFANEKSFFAFVSFRKVVNKVIEAPKNYLKYMLFIVLFSVIVILLKFVLELVLAMFTMTPFVTMIVTTFISGIISAYFSFVLMYLVAKSLKPNSVV